MKNPPYNHNKPWSKDEDKALLHMFDINSKNAKNLREIADILGRTLNAIRLRLTALGRWVNIITLVDVRTKTKNDKKIYYGGWKKEEKKK